jgi:hypothetical protein
MLLKGCVIMTAMDALSKKTASLPIPLFIRRVLINSLFPQHTRFLPPLLPGFNSINRTYDEDDVIYLIHHPSSSESQREVLTAF